MVVDDNMCMHAALQSQWWACLGRLRTSTCYSVIFSWFPVSPSRVTSATFTLTYLEPLLSWCFVSYVLTYFR